MMVLLRNFRLVDEDMDMIGSVLAEDGVIKDVAPGGGAFEDAGVGAGADALVDGKGAVLTPAFVDMHAHFRDPYTAADACAEPAETLESGCLAARAGGYGAVVCMANTKPPVDTLARVRRIQERCAALGVIDVRQAAAFTRNMEGKELAEWADADKKPEWLTVISEDGRDIEDDALFQKGLESAARHGLLVSCHCDKGGEAAAVRRAVEIAKKAAEKSGCTVKLHICHVSLRDSVDIVRRAKAERAANLALTCEAAPHHIALNEADADRLNKTTYGKVAPPLAGEDDRRAVLAGIAAGVIDCIATDHAPHTAAAKEQGAPGFCGLETAFAVCYTELVKGGIVSLRKLASLMSAAPARILGMRDRGRIAAGFRADFAALDLETAFLPNPHAFKSRSRNSPFVNRHLNGIVRRLVNPF